MRISRQRMLLLVVIRRTVMAAMPVAAVRRKPVSMGMPQRNDDCIDREQGDRE